VSAACAYCIVAVLGAAAPAHGQRARSAHLESELSARSAALQGAFAADDGDALDIFRAPCTALTGDGWRLGASYVRALFDTSAQGLAASHAGALLGIGGGLLAAQTAGVEDTDALGRTIGTVPVFDSAGLLTVAARLGSHATGGVSAKGFLSRIGSLSTTGVAFDAELRYRLDAPWGDTRASPDDRRIDVAALLRNVGVQGAFVRTGDPLPSAFAVSAIARAPIGPALRASLGILAERMLDLREPFRAAGAVEIGYAEWVAVRFGYRLDETMNRWSAGVGFSFGGLRLDYALRPFAELGPTHRLSLSYALPAGSPGH